MIKHVADKAGLTKWQWLYLQRCLGSKLRYHNESHCPLLSGSDIVLASNKIQPCRAILPKKRYSDNWRSVTKDVNQAAIDSTCKTQFEKEN